MNYQGKVAFITGGASGIGLAMARAFCDEGMHVIIADVEEAALEKALKQLGDKVRGMHLDVSDRQAVYAAASEAESYWGKIHIVCNNAGVGAGGPVQQMSDNDWDWTLGVNLYGVIHGVQAFLPKMLAHGEGGHFINTASIAGHIAGPGLCAYQTTKYAVVGLSESMARDLEPLNIAVSVLCPGLVDTGIFESERNRPSHLPSSAEQTLAIDGKETLIAMMQEAGHQFGKVRQADEVAALVVKAMKAGQFYIFPHPELKGLLDRRYGMMTEAMDWASAEQKP